MSENEDNVIMMNGGPISWKSVKQKSVSLSTVESEWYAASEAGKELLDANEGLPVSEEQYQERFWQRRLDGIGLNTATK